MSLKKRFQTHRLTHSCKNINLLETNTLWKFLLPYLLYNFLYLSKSFPLNIRACACLFPNCLWPNSRFSYISLMSRRALCISKGYVLNEFQKKCVVWAEYIIFVQDCLCYKRISMPKIKFEMRSVKL